jgi:hypothetical protein
MVSAAVIVVVSTALLLFYLQSVCSKILGRRFEQDFYHAIVNANRLEFPFVRSAVEEYEVPVDYPRFRMQLKCDFLALTYLLRNAANATRRLSRQEWLLVWYFRGTYLFLGAFHVLGLSERPWILRMTRVLEYFANVLGERVSSVRFGDISASEYLLSL